MRHLRPTSIAMVLIAACGGGSSAGPSSGGTTAAAEQPADGDDAAQLEPGADNEFQLRDSDTAEDAHGATPSEIEATETEAAMRFFVVDKDQGPVEGIVIKMTAPDGTEYFTGETDSEGYAEVLVPVGQKYELEYLSLGRRDITARVPVADEPNLDIKLTLRYKRHGGQRAQGAAGADGAQDGQQQRFVLKGVRFDSGKATLRPESHDRLEGVVEYMEHKPSARIRVSGHTDNVGNARANKRLSKKRAEAVRDYLVSQGIDASRIEAVGHGDERPVASNDTEEGRQKNRRIEVVEL